jgi:hypothetical protein
MALRQVANCILKTVANPKSGIYFSACTSGDVSRHLCPNYGQHMTMHSDGWTHFAKFKSTYVAVNPCRSVFMAGLGKDLKSRVSKETYRFNSGPGHHLTLAAPLPLIHLRALRAREKEF